VLGYCAINPYLGAYGPLTNPVINFLQAIGDASEARVTSALGVYPLEEGIDSATIEAEWKRGLEAASVADVIIAVMGDTKKTCSEGRDRSFLELAGRQQDYLKELKKLGKPVVLVLNSGRPVALKWESENIDAIVNVFCPGPQGALALAKALFGEINPAGRLPVSFPRSSGNIPCIYNPLPGAPHGYVDAPQGPLYPFGHGLSYTSFEYSSLELRPDDKGVNCTLAVKNTGNRDGDEVVQIYVKDVFSSVTTPDKNLKAFRRVALKAGESRTMSFFIPFRQLSLLDRQFRRVTEKGEFIVMAGSSSADIRLTSSFTLAEDLSFDLKAWD
jgi:beta-glucosidase